MKFNDWADLAILGGTAYLGYSVLGPNGALMGAVGYKLATTDGIVSQASGIITLTSLGLIKAASIAGVDFSFSNAQDEINKRVGTLEHGILSSKEEATSYIQRVETTWQWYKVADLAPFLTLDKFIDQFGLRLDYNNAKMILAPPSGGGGVGPPEETIPQPTQYYDVSVTPKSSQYNPNPMPSFYSHVTRSQIDNWQSQGYEVFIVQGPYS